jgi:arylsulfatase A-like enzyme
VVTVTTARTCSSGVYCSHPLLFEETVRVPLMVKFPGRLHSGEEVSAPVGHQDLMPTILKHFGAERSAPRCRDLGEHLGAPSMDGDRALLAFHNRMIQACVRRGPWLYIENLDLERVGLQNRGLYDSVGLFDLSGGRAENPAVEAEMAGLLRAYLDVASLEHPPASRRPTSRNSSRASGTS